MVKNMKKIGIIGGGASGVITALQSWKQLGHQVEITIFDPSPKLGYGKAYSENNTNHILNVPASNMSIYHDGSDDFESWVLEQDPSLRQSSSWPYVPRFHFGQYLETHFSKLPKDHIKHIQHKVTNVCTVKEHYCLTLENNTTYDIDYLFIATGFSHTPYSLPVIKNHDQKSRVIHTSDMKDYKSLDFSKNVLIIGTGLTAIDIWRELRENKELKITLLSRHGFLPQPKVKTDTQRVKYPVLSGMSPLQIFEVLRTLQRVSNILWTEIAAAIEPQVQKIWTCWTPREKSMYLRYLKPHWEIIRHGMPPSVFSALEKDIKEGGTTICAGQINAIEELNSNILIKYRERRSYKDKSLSMQHVIFAMGSGIDQTLLDEKSVPGIRKCPYGFGYMNQNAPRLWFIGPAAKGTYYDITSVPYIRSQVHNIMGDIKKRATPKQSLKRERFFIHPIAAGESYFEHLKQAMSFSRCFFKVSWYAFVHALLPFLYTDTPSARLRDVGGILSKRRKRSVYLSKQKTCSTNLTNCSTHQNHEASSHHQTHQQTYH